MTRSEIAVIVREMPRDAVRQAIGEANEAVVYWLRQQSLGGGIHGIVAAKEVAIEVSLIFSGALNLLAATGRR